MLKITKILDASDAEDLVEDKIVDANAEGGVGEEGDVEGMVEDQENGLHDLGDVDVESKLHDLGDVDDLHVTEKAEGEGDSDLEVDEEVLGVVEVSTSMVDKSFWNADKWKLYFVFIFHPIISTMLNMVSHIEYLMNYFFLRISGLRVL